MPNIMAPLRSYRQPSALCRTLVYQWAGDMLLSELGEDQIISKLVTSDWMLYEIKNAKAKHHSKETVAYNLRERSPVNKTTVVEDQRTFCGVLLIEKQSTTNAAAAADIANAVRDASRHKKHAAYALSLHYGYEKHKNSAHTVGLYMSAHKRKGRGSSVSFFDPNVGSWSLGTLDSSLEFATKEWLPRFLANTLATDPGHETKGARQMSYFRLVNFEPC